MGQQGLTPAYSGPNVQLPPGQSPAHTRSALPARQLCRVAPCSAHILCPAQRCGASRGGPQPVAHGALLLFPAMLCLRREGGCHHMRRERLCTQLPPALCQGRGMHHPVLWRLQVRAVSSSQAREEPAVTPPSSLTEPEPGPGPPTWSSAPLAALLTLPIPSIFPRCYCWEHRPRQEIQEAPEEGTICLICLEPVGDSLSYHTMACPTCQHAWFHRGCIQVGALPSPCRHAWSKQHQAPLGAQ